MFRFLAWAVLPIGLMIFLFLSASEALNRPIVKVRGDGECLSVLLIKEDQEIEVGCDAVDLRHDRYNTRYVLSPREMEEIQKTLAQK